MKKEVIVKLHASFEESVQKDEDGGEYWLARDLQQLLGYAKWENFAKVIGKAKTACTGSGVNPDDHFLDVRKMIGLGKGATRQKAHAVRERVVRHHLRARGRPNELCPHTQQG